MKNLFYGCSSLIIIPDISIWKKTILPENVENIFYGCSSSIIKPDLSKWVFLDADPNFPYSGEKRDNTIILDEILGNENNLYNDTEIESSYLSNIKENIGSNISVEFLSNISNINNPSNSDKNEEINYKNIKLIDNNEFDQINEEFKDYYENFYD